MTGADTSKYFLGYQAAWLRDTSRFKIAKKSRRVGLTYAQSFEDVLDASSAENPMDVWFSSADESAAKEYVRYCAFWAGLLNIAAKELGEVVIDSDKDVKALSVQFANGKRINALTSNPKAFRSKGGKLVLDEFGFHGDGDAMWKAARPIITWGYPVRIISTLNGKNNRYYRIVSEAERARDGGKKSVWSLHTITIEQAVADGLPDKILGRPLTIDERQQWLAEEKEAVGDEDTWRQEYMCEALDDASHWLDWSLIVAAESPDAGKPELYAGGNCTLGWDVARRRDGSILTVREKVGDVGVVREVVRCTGQRFSEQYAEVDRLFANYNIVRFAIDQTGMGEKIVEDMQDAHGAHRVEGVMFTGATKQHLATLTKQAYEDRRVRAPADKDFRTAHHAVKKTTTLAGNPRFDAERTDKSHADEFWSHALAIYADETAAPPAAGDSVEAEAGTYAADRRGRRASPHMFGKRAARTSGHRGRVGPRSAPSIPGRGANGFYKAFQGAA